MDIQKLHQLFLKNMSICTDTRAMVNKSLFFALKGENFNGNKYACQALEDGAEYAIIDEEKYRLNDKYILVENVLLTLQKLANYHRKQLKCPVLGITGTNGKTTTKELLAIVLETKYKVVATKGNLNNDIGVPLTILTAPLDTEFLIIEMGANHKREIDFLCNIAEINYGIITNIGKAHLEGFGSFEGVIETKKELYDYLNKTKGTAFVNKDDRILNAYNKEITKVFYSLDSSNNLNTNPFVSLSYSKQKINTKLIGDYNALNIVAACAIGEYFKVSSKNITSAIENYNPDNNRSQLVNSKKGNTIILDAYNANPSSMETAINSFNKLQSESKVLILGDMLELGIDSESEHQKIINILNVNSYKKVILVGVEFAKSKHNFKHFYSSEELIEWSELSDVMNSTILLKGSRKIALEKLVEKL